MRRTGPAFLGTLVCGTLACAPTTGGAPSAPQPHRAGWTGERTPVAVAVPRAGPEDSLADQAALEALHALEFGSLSKGGDHIRGSVPAPRLAAQPDGPRGGAAAATGPAFDIDVASFAERDRVRYFREYFLGPTRARFVIWLGRLARYEGMIRNRFRLAGIPEDLVYLGIIESGYSNTAVSRANAVGMWQFMSYTARAYGLRVDTWVDERRDPFRATDAAARHLADLYGEFGSWYLAAAAYNGGAGRVLRGLRRLATTPEAASDETFFDLSARRYLRRETRDYVPKLIAAAIIAKAPVRYGFDSIPYLAPLVFDEIAVPAQTGLDVIAELADTTARAIMELNPHFVRGATPPGEGAIVRVPRGTGTLVSRRYAALPPNERVNFVEHVVRRGETLSEIGLRYGVSVWFIQAANGNVHPRRLRVGRRLVIPVSPAARSRAEAGRAPTARSGVSGVRFHTIRWGDTLWRLSQRYGVSIDELRHWNAIGVHDVLRPGDRLRLTPP